MTWSIFYSPTQPIFSVLLWMFTAINFPLQHGPCQWQRWFDLTVNQKVYYMIKTKNQLAVSRVRALALIREIDKELMLETSVDNNKLPCYTLPPMQHQRGYYPFYSYLQYLWSWRTSSISTTCRAIRWLHFSLAAKTPHFKILKL